jgi:hypothetical protein
MDTREPELPPPVALYHLATSHYVSHALQLAARLVNTGGRQRSEPEFRALYGASGFAVTRIVPTSVRVSIIEGAALGAPGLSV